jgi:peptide deformylase
MDNYAHHGETLKVYKYPASVLKKVSENVTVFDDDLATLCQNMLYTMYEAPGIGLAAPQVGISKRIFVIDTEFKREKVLNSQGESEIRLSNFSPLIFINPAIKDQAGTTIQQEGCLSFPGIYEDVKRAESITIEYQNMQGEKLSMPANDLLSVCVQHENDHLDGIVFLDRLSFLKKSMLTKKFLKKKSNK